jgi:hypothetical protein
VLWQHVVLCKSYGAENAPDCGCVWCVMLCETGSWHTTHTHSDALSATYSYTKRHAATAPCYYTEINPLNPNDPYRGRTAQLTCKCFMLYIYSTNIGTEYFRHGIYSPLFSLQNAVCFIILTYLFPVLFTFYIKGVLKLKK